MYWEEKIDLLKKKFSDSDFHVPFTNGAEILQKIEAKFIINHDPRNQHSYWSDSIKDVTFIRNITKQTVNLELARLESYENYWVVIEKGKTSTSKYIVYDCKVNSLEALLSFTSTDFYLIHKNYDWFTFFNASKTTHKIAIYKSGPEQTPFDRSI